MQADSRDTRAEFANKAKENRPQSHKFTSDGFTRAQANFSHTKERQRKFLAESDQLEQHRNKLRQEERALKVSTVLARKQKHSAIGTPCEWITLFLTNNSHLLESRLWRDNAPLI